MPSRLVMLWLVKPPTLPCLASLDKRSETGGLHSTLKLAVGAHIMLTVNVDVSDGLVNPFPGELIFELFMNNDQANYKHL